MRIFKSDKRFHSVLDITADDIKAAGAKVVLLDADNTLSFHNSKKPYPGVEKWIEEIRENGIEPVIISNNSEARIKPFAEKLGVPFVAKSKKPLSKGFGEGCKMFGISPKEAVVIGDQVFTDVVGGNLFGAKVFMTEPLGPETDFFIKIKRIFEKPLR